MPGESLNYARIMRIIFTRLRNKVKSIWNLLVLVLSFTKSALRALFLILFIQFRSFFIIFEPKEQIERYKMIENQKIKKEIKRGKHFL
jgi:hypothetical protein